MGPQDKECRWILEAEKGKEMYFPLEPPKRNVSRVTLILT